eukprot:COSAG04_NODE_17145_length_478_cov_0.416887_2_plen_34_part_01
MAVARGVVEVGAEHGGGDGHDPWVVKQRLPHHKH